MTEQWRPNKIVVHGGNRLSWVDVSKLHEGRLVLRFENKGYTQIQLIVFNKLEVTLRCRLEHKPWGHAHPSRPFFDSS